MLKRDLRRSGMSEITLEPKQSWITVLWVALTAVLVIIAYAVLMHLVENFGVEAWGDHTLTWLTAFIRIFVNIGPHFVGLLFFSVLTLLVYLLLKLFFTVLFSWRAIGTIRMTFLSNNWMPVCLCREALRVWQVVVIHFVPILLMFSFYTVLCWNFDAEPIFLTLFLFMLFFLAFDLTLVAYVVYLKITEKMDYVSIERHVYMITLFSRSYVKFMSERRKKRKIMRKKRNRL